MIGHSLAQQRGRSAGAGTVKPILAVALQIGHETLCTAHPRLPPSGGASGEVG